MDGNHFFVSLFYTDSFKDPFNTVIASIRGHSTPTSLNKLRSLYQHDRAAWSMSQSLNGKYLYSGGNDWTIRIWDVETSKLLSIIVYHNDKVYQIQEHCITLSRQW